MLAVTTNDIVLMAIANLALVAVFAGFTVVGWAKQRRREREAYYRAEVQRQLAEQGRLTAADIMRMNQEEHRWRWLQRRERIRLAGLVVGALGAGSLIAQGARDGAMAVGWIPLAVGAAALGYGWLLYPGLECTNSDAAQPSDRPRASIDP